MPRERPMNGVFPEALFLKRLFFEATWRPHFLRARKRQRPRALGLQELMKCRPSFVCLILVGGAHQPRATAGFFSAATPQSCGLERVASTSALYHSVDDAGILPRPRSRAAAIGGEGGRY
jgi:hypothetical protein